jgi:VanZ family protein
MTDSTDFTDALPRRATLAFWGLAVAWAGAIFWLSSLPGSQLPGRFPPEVGHFGAYFILAALLYAALRANGRQGRAILLAIVIASVYGISDEFHQSFVPMRTPDVADWVMDTFGASCGAAAVYALATLRARKVSPSRDRGQRPQ